MILYYLVCHDILLQYRGDVFEIFPREMMACRRLAVFSLVERLVLGAFWYGGAFNSTHSTSLSINI